MAFYTRKRRKSEINIVPLVDVLIVLIFFFLITIEIDKGEVKALNITPPQMETAGKNDVSDDIVIAIDTEGNYFFNNSPVEETMLFDLIKKAGALNPEQTVLVVADEETPLKHLAKVMDRCRKAKLESLRLQTR